MKEEQEKNKLWKSYYILLGVIIGGTVFILGSQAVWKAIQQNFFRLPVAKNNPPSITSSPTIILSPQSIQPSNLNNLNQEEAVQVLYRYLNAKADIFARPYDRQLAANLTTGEYYRRITKPGGDIDWLQERNAYYRYGKRQVEPVGYFEVNDGQAQIDVRITQDFSYYEYGNLKNSYTDYSKVYRFTLILENGTWKIAGRQSEDKQDKN